MEVGLCKTADQIMKIEAGITALNGLHRESQDADWFVAQPGRVSTYSREGHHWRILADTMIRVRRTLRHEHLHGISSIMHCQLRTINVCRPISVCMMQACSRS